MIDNIMVTEIENTDKDLYNICIRAIVDNDIIDDSKKINCIIEVDDIKGLENIPMILGKVINWNYSK